MMKRRRADSDEGEDAKLAALLEASEEYTPYVPLKQRLKGGNGGGTSGVGGAAREEQKHGRERDHEPAIGDDSGDEDAEDLEAAHAHAAAEKERRKREIEAQVAEAKKSLSLLDVQDEMRRKREQMDPTQIKLDLQRQQEARILGEASQVQTNALQSAAERAHGVQYTESMKTGWTPPAHIRAMTREECDVRLDVLLAACVRVI